MDYFSEFATAYGLDLDGACILDKVSLQEVETGAVVPVGRFYTEKEWRHTPTLRQVQPKQTSIPRDPPVRRLHQRKNWWTYPMDGYQKSYIDNTGWVQITESVSRINKDEICLTDISLKQRTALLIHTAREASTRRSKMWTNRAKATYPPKLRVS